MTAPIFVPSLQSEFVLSSPIPYGHLQKLSEDEFLSMPYGPCICSHPAKGHGAGESSLCRYWDCPCREYEEEA